MDQVPAVGIAFDPDGNVLAATGHDHTVKFFLTSNLRLIGTDLHAAATRGVVFAAKGPTAFTYGDDGIVNKLASLSASSSIRIGDVAGFAVASELAEIAYWVETAKGAGKVFVVQPDMAQPGFQVGELNGGGWGGISFGPTAILVRTEPSVFCPRVSAHPDWAVDLSGRRARTPK